MNAVGGKQLDVRIVNETDAVQIDDAQVGCVRFDFPDIYDFIDFLSLLIS